MAGFLRVLSDVGGKFAAAIITIYCLILLPFWQAIVLGLAGDRNGCLAVAIAWPALFVLAFTVHELGHLAAGMAMKLSPRELVLGLFRWQKDPLKWRLSINRDWNRNLALVRFELPLQPRMGYRFGVMLIGGPLANVVFTGLCLGLALYFFHFPPFGSISTPLRGFQPTGSFGQFLWFAGNRFTAILNAAAFISLHYALAPLVPGYGLTMKTDGLQLWELWRHGRVGNLILLKSWPAHLGPMPTTPGLHRFPPTGDDTPPPPRP